MFRRARADRIVSRTTSVPMFRLDATSATEIIADEVALATLRQYTVEEVLAQVDDPEKIDNEEEAFNALMEAMYRLRPQGYL